MAELRPLLEHLGHEVSEERLQEVMKKFDVNGDGELCKKEVRAMVDELKELVLSSYSFDVFTVMVKNQKVFMFIE